MDGSANQQSGAELTLRSNTDAVIARVGRGSDVISALRTAGYSRHSAKRIIAIGNGGHPDVTDDGLRAACQALVQATEAAAAEVDAALGERWKLLATTGDDWRSIAELLKRRNPEEWLVTEKTELELAGSVGVRSEDAVLEALRRMQEESGHAPSIEPGEAVA